MIKNSMMASETALQQISQPLTLFLIGVTGDLSRHKILKAVYSLFTMGLLPQQFNLVGVARSEYSREEFHTFIKTILQPVDEKKWTAFCQGIYYISGDVTQPATFDAIKDWHEQQGKCGNHLWYLATLPSLYVKCIQLMKQTGLSQVDCGWTKVMLEKPFGTDTASARQLDKELLQVFAEDQIYRIDHFLAKETVQNILIFRFANGLFEHLWSREFIDHIQIHSTETLGVTGREIFYDQTGTIRDYVQNHVLHVLATTLMEQPRSLAAADIRAQRTALLTQLQPFTTRQVQTQVAYGQYTTGLADGKAVLGYLDEKRIAPDSRTETAVAFKCFIDSPRWQGVPIYIRAGKRLSETMSEISIVFKEPQNSMFAAAKLVQKPNILTLRINPHEGIEIKLYVKKPGIQLGLEEVPIEFFYKNVFNQDLVEAYIKVIYDAVQGDPTLFPDAKGIEACWQFVQPLLDQKSQTTFRPDPYPAGSQGPKSFETLMESDGRQWYFSHID